MEEWKKGRTEGRTASSPEVRKGRKERRKKGRKRMIIRTVGRKERKGGREGRREVGGGRRGKRRRARVRKKTSKGVVGLHEERGGGKRKW